MAGLDYEFAPIDVSIMTHPKACAAGPEAMGLWLWGQTYAKLHRTGGVVHRPAALTAWGGRRNIMLAKRLVEVGLWIDREDGSWEIHNFEKKAPGTRPRGSEPSKSSTERMRAYRARRAAEAAVTVTDVVTDVTVTQSGVTRHSDGDGSTSTSISISSSGESPRGGPPDWWSDACDTVEMAHPGVKLNRDAAWLRYYGHRSTTGKRIAQPDAVYWLTSVDAREAAKDREERRRQDARDARYERHRSGVPPPAEPQKLTEAEQKELADKYPMPIRRRQDGAA